MDINLIKLEFNKIINILTNYCITSKGKELARNLLPSNNFNEVQNMLDETKEAVSLTIRNSCPSFYEFQDIDLSIKNLESGISLSPFAILNLNKILEMSYELKNYFNKDYIDASNYPILSKLFSLLYTNKNIIDKIHYCISDEGIIEDNASSTLKSIRNKQKNLENDIRTKLNDMIHGNFSKYLQDNIITIRNDRFVIPVKEEYRLSVKGFVHDVSNAGSTLFIEPISIFEMNNEINKLKLDEELEIEIILQKLSFLFEPYIEELKQDVELIGKLDFIFAKAKYSKELDGITPLLNTQREINLKNARHPLIDKNTVVPISLNLGKDFSCLLITGPNTGGKTVSLKTVGLLSCMACAGLNIPASENSSIYVFDKIFADIGDDQSISNSLSTFSSHMLNIVSIIKNATKNSLVLVDELGSGTDPIEGANLAISILEHLYNLGALTIATTHYQELKQYALITPGFENASVEFNINTLKPTYNLLVGIPGKSNAFAISKNLGLPNSIIENAKALMSKDQINFEKILKNIYDQKSLIENEKIEIDKKLEHISTLEKSLITNKENLQKQEQDILNNAKINARDILLNAKDEASNIIKELNQITNTKTAENLRNQLNKSISSLNNMSMLENNKKHQHNSNSLDIKDIKPNMTVFIRKFNSNGIVLSRPSKSNEVQVQIGLIKTNLSINELEQAHTDLKKEKVLTSTYTNLSKAKNVKSEINVIGLNVEEAIFVVDKFLDDATLSKLSTVRIVHGKGTGKLMNGIHKFLKTNPHVASYRIGTYGEGEMGVTVVELRK